MGNSSWYVYVLFSDSAHSTYVGISTDPPRRLEQHNGLRNGGARTTTRGRPWRIAALHGPFESRGEAQSIEAALKTRRGQERLRWSGPTQASTEASTGD